MSTDDQEVIIYKILEFIYEAQKRGKQLRVEDIYCKNKLFSIPYTYWLSIMEEIIDNGFVKGLRIEKWKTDNPDNPLHTEVLEVGNIALTIKGREYLADNSRITKAKEFANESFQSLLTAVVSGLMNRPY